jgi:site-specific DNA recombinase
MGTLRPMKAIVYVRVSTEEQGKSGLGLEAQRQKALAYCQLHDHEVVEVVEDAGASGKSLDRPGMGRVLQAVDRREVEVVVVAKLDRATRSVRDLGELLERFNRAKVALASVSEHLDTSTAAGRMVVGMLGVIAQWERETIVERITDAMDVKRRRGERVSRFAPTGWRFVGDRRVEDVAVRVALRNARAMQAEGRSLRDIATALNATGFRTQAGGRHHAMSVKRLLDSAAAQGIAA